MLPGRCLHLMSSYRVCISQLKPWVRVRCEHIFSSFTYNKYIIVNICVLEALVLLWWGVLLERGSILWQFEVCSPPNSATKHPLIVLYIEVVKFPGVISRTQYLSNSAKQIYPLRLINWAKVRERCELNAAPYVWLIKRSVILPVDWKPNTPPSFVKMHNVLIWSRVILLCDKLRGFIIIIFIIISHC